MFSYGLKTILVTSLLQQVACRVGTTKTPPQHRELTKTKAKEEVGFCNPKGKPNFQDGDFGVFAFHTAFDPKCSCVDEDNTEDLMSMLEKAASTLDFKEVFDQTIGDFRGEKSYECINGCEVCLDNEGDDEEPVCGILESDVTYSFVSAVSKDTFALEEVLSGSVMELLEPKAVLGNPDYAVEFCIKYTSGHEGRFCFGADIIASKEEDEEDVCFVGHDEKMCSSCEMTEEDGRYCLTADCSNIGGSEKMNSCTGEGLDGVFKMVDVFFNEEEPTFKAGTCGDLTVMHDSKP